jgi:hypothetical protein
VSNRPLPQKILDKLRHHATKQGWEHHPVLGTTTLGRMHNIDHRSKSTFRENRSDSKTDRQNTDHWGGRVRQMDVHRQFPEVELVLKRNQGVYGTAQQEIDELYRRIDQHQTKFAAKEQEYVLRRPFGYAIGEDLIAMRKTNKPSIPEIVLGIHGHTDSAEETNRGRVVRERFQKNGEFDRFREVIERLQSRLLIGYGNIIYIGKRNGKYCFTTLIDVS